MIQIIEWYLKLYLLLLIQFYHNVTHNKQFIGSIHN